MVKMNVKKLRQLIAANNLIIATVEKQAGFQNGAIRKILVGSSKNPSIDTLGKLCTILKCSLDEIVDIEGLTPEYVKLIENNDEWRMDLFIAATNIAHQLTSKKQKKLTLEVMMPAIVSIYLFSLRHNGGTIDMRFAEWTTNLLLKGLTKKYNNKFSLISAK